MLKFVLLCREFSSDPKFKDAVTSEVSLTAGGLSSGGHEVCVLAGQPSEKETDTVPPNSGVSIVRIPEEEIVSPFQYGGLLKAIKLQNCDVLVTYLSFMLFPKFARLLTRLRVSAFHRIIHGRLFLQDAMGRMFDLLVRYPLTYGRMDFYDLARLIYPDFMLRAARRTNALGTIIPTSNKARRWLITAGIQNDVIVVPPPVSPNWFIQRDTSKERASEPPRIVYYGGGPLMLRGLDTLLTSMKKIGGEKLKAELYVRLVGQRDERLIRNLAQKLGLSSRVLLVNGFVSPSFLQERICSADCVVLPFKIMGTIADIPLTAIEPMACGVPVISTRIGGMPEIIQHEKNGLLIKPSDSSELSNAIKLLLKNAPLRTRLSSNAKKAAERYRSDAIVKELANIYERTT